MLDFKEVKEPRLVKSSRMSLKEYSEFCLFCIQNNPKLASQDPMSRDRSRKEMKVPFHFPDDE